jgi:hypothetical protein
LGRAWVHSDKALLAHAIVATCAAVNSVLPVADGLAAPLPQGAALICCAVLCVDREISHKPVTDKMQYAVLCVDRKI